MSKEPENLTHAILRDMRAENKQFRAEVLSVMEQLKTVMTYLQRSSEAAAKASEEVHLMRADMVREFQKVHSDVLHLDNQNISRHSETMTQLRRIEELEKAAARTDSTVGKLAKAQYGQLRTREGQYVVVAKALKPKKTPFSSIE